MKIGATTWAFVRFAKDWKGWTLRDIMAEAWKSRASIYRILKSMEIKQAISERVTDEKSDSSSISSTNFEIKVGGKSVYCQEIIGWLLPSIS